MTNIKDPIRRTQAYWYVDGLVELGTGVLFLMLGFVLIIEGAILDNASLANTLSFVRNFLMIGGTIGIGLLTKYIKSRLTYPRTGYIAYPQPKGRQLGKVLGIGLGFAFTASVGLVLAILYIPALQTMIAYMPSWLMVGLGIFAGGVYLSWGLRTGLRRFYWLAGLGLFTGLILAWPSRGLNLIEGQSYLRTGPGIFLIVMGIGLCISGTTTLRNYLKNTQPQNGNPGGAK
jgi:hypothetical protein